MIRRFFWLVLGAVLGVTGYRRLTMLVHSWSPAARAGQVAGFVADVREGMALYQERHPRPGAPALESHTSPAASARVRERNRDRQRAGTPRFHPDDTKDGS